MIVGGGPNGQALDAAAVRALATGPSLDELRGKIIGLLQAPARKLAGPAGPGRTRRGSARPMPKRR